MAIGNLTILVGAGVIGSMLANDGHLPDITRLLSGAFRFVTRNLKQDNDNSRPTSKPQTDSLVAQVNTLRAELEVLARSRSVTIVTGAGSAGSGRYGVKAVIVVGALGYVFIWWKGWKLSDMMFVTRRGFSDVCNRVGKQLDQVSSSIAAAKRQLSSRIDHVDSNLEECKELTAATKCEVSQLHGDLSLIQSDVESVHRAFQTLETKLCKIEGSQEFATRGVYHLCQFVERLEQGRSKELIQDSPSSSERAIEFPQTSPVVTRTISLPPLSVESAPLSGSLPPSASPSAHGNPRVFRSTAVSASGLKELQEISSAISLNLSSGNTPKASIRTTEEPSGAASNFTWSAWKLPSILSRSRSNAT